MRCPHCSVDGSHEKKQAESLWITIKGPMPVRYSETSCVAQNVISQASRTFMNVGLEEV